MGLNVEHSNGNGVGPAKVEDFTQIGVIAVYLVQKLGKPTLREIQEAARDRLNCNIHGRTLKRALEAASRAGRGLIAVLQGRDPSGALVDNYAMKDPQRWKNPPEYAHLSQLLPRLLADPATQELKNWFDQGEQAPAEQEKKKMRGNDVDDFHTFQAWVYTTDTLLGSQIPCLFTDFARNLFPDEEKARLQAKNKASKAKESKVPSTAEEGDEQDDDAENDGLGIFVMDELTGDRLLTPDALAAWFVVNATRYAGLPDIRGSYVGFKAIRIKAKPIPLTLPVNNSKTGASKPKTYEAIPAGQVLLMEFVAPTKGMLSSEQYEKLLHIVGDRPRRGFSPARGRRYGHFKVVGFKDLGPLKGTGIDYVLADLPPEIAKYMKTNKLEPKPPTPEEMAAYLQGAVKRLSSVNLGARHGHPGLDSSMPPIDN